MPSRSFRNNNPGNIRDSSWTRAQPGFMGHDAEGFAIFSDWGHGVAAITRLLCSSSYRNLTLREIISRYAPAKENDVNAYVAFVCTRAGIKADEKITAPHRLCEVMAAMIVHEGWKS